MLAPERAAELVLERAAPLSAESVPLASALGRVLADDVRSTDDIPGFDNSAMDGFAVRAADTAGAASDQPVPLEITGESRAGQPAAIVLESGQAIRISTGALLPAGADAVVRLEDSRDEGDVVQVLGEVSPGKEVRRRGEDIRAGDLVLRHGAELGPAELGVLASVGVAEASCFRRPRVAVIATGDELVEPGVPLKPGEIRNTNRYAVPAQAVQAGAEVARVSVVGDDPDATLREIDEALDSDVLVCCGGVSVGPHDHVKPALERLGVEEVFWGIALRPGHPTWFGVRGKTLVFGLPGNPVSAMVTFHLFVRPAIRALLGATARTRRAVAIMDEGYSKSPGRAHVVRCRLEARADGWHVRPTKAQGSHVLTSMLDAEAFAMLDVERGDVGPGERVEIELL
jgi:molybdopterin molybdotransferase